MADQQGKSRTRFRHGRPPPLARLHDACIVTNPRDHAKVFLPTCETLDRSGADGSSSSTSQLPPTKRHEYLGDPTVADAILDRVLHNAHRLVLKGPTRRKEKDQLSAAA
jgi:hypothetical protein